MSTPRSKQFRAFGRATTVAVVSAASMHAHAALTTYTSEVDFLNAAGTVVVESFESSTGTAITSLTTPSFLLTHTGSSFSVLTAPSQFAAFAVDGTHYLEESSALVINEFRFSSLGAGVTAFGLYITDYGDFGARPLTLTVNSISQFVIAKPAGAADNGSLHYFGVVSSPGNLITEIRLSSDDAIGIDKVSISAVPELPSSALTLSGIFFAALLRSVAWLRRR